MNQEKIGKFICECRKEKKITQSQLAEYLGVTDRSVSNWENGKNMPDLSLFKPLCEILDITINELLSGEKIDKNNYQKKLEENIINTINYSNEKIKQKNQLIGLIILLFGFIITMLGLTVFNPDSHSCLFSIILGIVLSTLGFYKLIKTKSYLKNIILLILFFTSYLGLITLFDYIGVCYNDRPPIFSMKITTVDDTIYYDTLFYDVIRCNKNKDNETYKVIKSQKYTIEKVMKVCK